MEAFLYTVSAYVWRSALKRKHDSTEGSALRSKPRLPCHPTSFPCHQRVLPLLVECTMIWVWSQVNAICFIQLQLISLDGQHQRVDTPADARTAHNGLLQRRMEEDPCWIVPHAPPKTQSVKRLNRTDISRSSSMNMLHAIRKLFGRFCSEPTGLSLCCHAKACGSNMAATIRAFRAYYYMWRSDWLKLLGWMAVRNPLVMRSYLTLTPYCFVPKRR